MSAFFTHSLCFFLGVFVIAVFLDVLDWIDGRETADDLDPY